MVSQTRKNVGLLRDHLCGLVRHLPSSPGYVPCGFYGLVTTMVRRRVKVSGELVFREHQAPLRCLVGRPQLSFVVQTRRTSTRADRTARADSP